MKPKLIKLKNGLRVITLQNKKIKSVYFSFMFGTNSTEFIEKNGLAHLVEHCIMDSKESIGIYPKLESLNSKFNGEVYPEYTLYYGSTYHKNLYRTLSLVKKILFNKKEPSAEFEKHKKVIFEELKSDLDDPASQSYNQMIKNRYIGKIIPGLPSIGEKATINSIIPSNITSFYDNYYNSNNLIISVCGNFDSKRLNDYLKNEFEELKYRSKIISKQERIKYSGRKIEIIKKNQNSTNVCITFPGYTWEDSDKERVTGNLISSYLTYFRSSILFKELRTNAKMVYFVDSSTYINKNNGFVSIEWNCSSENLESSLSITMSALGGLSSGKFDQDYIEKIKQIINIDNIIDQDNPEILTSYCRETLFYRNRLTFIDDLIKTRGSLSKFDIVRASKKIFDLNKINVMITGNLDKEKTESIVEKTLNI